MTSTGSADDPQDLRNAKLEAVARELSERNTALADARARLRELEAEVAARRKKAGGEGDVTNSAWYFALEELYDRVDWISPPMYLSPSCSPSFPPPECDTRPAGSTARFRLAPHMARAASQAAGYSERGNVAAGHAAGHERLVEIWSARSQASTADEAAGCPQEVQLPKSSEEAQVEALCSQLAMQAAAIASSHVEGLCRARCEAAAPELRAAELRAEVHHARGGEEAAGAAQAAASAALATVNALLVANAAALRAQQDAVSGAPLAHKVESVQACLAELQAGAEGLTKAVASTSTQLQQQLGSAAALPNDEASQCASAGSASSMPPVASEECAQSSSSCSATAPAPLADAAADAMAAAAAAADAATTAASAVTTTSSDNTATACNQQQDVRDVPAPATVTVSPEGLEDNAKRRGGLAVPRTSELAAVGTSREIPGSASPACRVAPVTPPPEVARLSSAPVVAPKPPKAVERTRSLVTSPLRHVVRAEEAASLQQRQSPSPGVRLHTPTSACCSPTAATRVQSPVRASSVRQRLPNQASQSVASSPSAAARVQSPVRANSLRQRLPHQATQPVPSSPSAAARVQSPVRASSLRQRPPSQSTQPVPSSPSAAARVQSPVRASSVRQRPPSQATQPVLSSPSAAARVQSPVRASSVRLPSKAVPLMPGPTAISASCCNLPTTPLTAVLPGQSSCGMQSPACPYPASLPGSATPPPMLAPPTPRAAMPPTAMAAAAVSADAPTVVTKVGRTLTPPRANTPVRMRSAQAFSPLHGTLLTAAPAPSVLSATLPASSSATALATPAASSHQQLSAVRRFGGDALQSIASVLVDQTPASQPPPPLLQRSPSTDDMEMLPTFGAAAQEDVHGESQQSESTQSKHIVKSLQNSRCTEQACSSECERSPSPTRQPPLRQVSASGLAILPPPRPAGTAAAGGVNGLRSHVSTMPPVPCHSPSPLAAQRVPLSPQLSPAMR